MRSFLIDIDQNRTFTNTTNQIKNWGTAGNYHWVVNQQGSSVFLIQGFKTINIYGILMTGSVQTTLGANDGAIVEDYQFGLSVVGQLPLVSGVIQTAPNDWAINQNSAAFDLGKYANRVELASPITGCTSIQFLQFKAQGNNGETLNSINLDISLQFQFFYKFDGE